MSPDPYLKLQSRPQQNADWGCEVSVLRAIIYFPLFQKNNLKRVRNRDRWKSLFWGEKRRFQYLSPFQNKMRTRPVKQPVKNKIRGTQHSRFLGYFLWLLFCFGFRSNLEWLEKVKIFSLCWGKKKNQLQLQNPLPCLERRYFSPEFSDGPPSQMKLGE